MRWSAAALALLALSAVAKPSHAVQELGLNVHQSTGVGLDVTRDAKLKWVRIDFNWLDAQPTAAAPDFTLFDSIVDGAKSRGLEVLAVVGYTPAWASSGDGKADGSLNDIPMPGAYDAFVTAAVQHFKDRVTHYELWNEPNLGQFFEGDPNAYVNVILKPGADAVHAACPTCKVVAPGLASVGGKYDVWMDTVLGAAKDKIDIVSGHVYAGFADDGNGQTSDSFFNKLESHRILQYNGVVYYEGPLSYREIMMQHGVTAPFWLTETGREAPLGDQQAMSLQTRYYRHVLEAMLTRPWWETTIFYEAFDEPNSGYNWGVVVDDPNGYKKKPVFDLLKQVVTSQPKFGGNGTDCYDGLDNDGDGLIDFPADPDCEGLKSPSEGLPPPDGGAAGGGGMGGAGGGGTGGANGGGGLGETPSSSSGCGCSVPGEGSSAAYAWIVAALAAIAARLPRRERRHHLRDAARDLRPPPA